MLYLIELPLYSYSKINSRCLVLFMSMEGKLSSDLSNTTHLEFVVFL